MSLDAVGWSGQRQTEFGVHAANGLIPGRIVSEHRSHFRVATNSVELSAAMTGRLRNAAIQRSDLAGVGDFVALRPAAGDGAATIEEVLRRTSALIRKASGEQRPQLLAANVDVVFIVTAPDGDFNLPRIERLLALVRGSAAAPVILLNKADIPDEVHSVVDQIVAFAPGVPVHAISARSGGGISDIERYFEGNQTVGLIGSSGVGKSTLTNKLTGYAEQATQEVRAHDSRGRHTTTHRQLFIRPQGGSLIDTPGMRGLELWKSEDNVELNFDDIEALASRCRFRNCRHDCEPGCAVRAALERGDIKSARLASYVAHARAQ
ncbi:ribosome small subunit-dependent GTPase A [Hyphomicrobium denitrificans]|uniref:ribosome small subunit-dependent GTPase A n=1 Tax=Hyphomicrobium denitrificans TaxID=53399 RepID=UPI00022E8264|nr:ribosome small subunit-dependent GTPase A [Hyphomicrobium denitrificans]